MDLIKWDSLLNPEKWFDDLPELSLTGWDLAADIYEKDGKLRVEMQLPGIDADTFEVSVDEGMLKIKGERKKDSEVEDKNYYRKEIHRGHFLRNIKLPQGDWDASKISSSVKDGVLTIILPKK